eukprot:gene476-861_t
MTTAALMRLLPRVTGVIDAGEEKMREDAVRGERYFPRSMIDLSKLFGRTATSTSRGAPLLTFGRGSREKCDVTLIERMDRDNNKTPFIVSRHHFTIARKSSSQYYIRDESAVNGTWLRHESADAADMRCLLPKRWYALRDGDIISLGNACPALRGDGDGEAARALAHPFLYVFRLIQSRCYACHDRIEGEEAINLCGARDHALCRECFIASASSQMRSCSNLEELTLASYYAPRCELCRSERHPAFMTEAVGAQRDRLLRDAFARAGDGGRSAGEWRQILVNRDDDDDVDDDEANSGGDFDDSRTPPTADEYRLLGESADVASILRAYRHELKVERPILMAILRAFRDAEDGVDAVKNDALLAVLDSYTVETIYTYHIIMQPDIRKIDILG